MSEKIREWTKSKLDDGVDPDRLKKILEKNGEDPSIVDEVQSPFESETEEKSEEDFEFEFSERNEEEMEQDESDSSTDLSLPDVSAPDFSLPDIETPSISKPSTPSRGKLAVISLVFVLLAGAGIGVTYFNLDDSVNKVLEPEPQCVGVKVYSIATDGEETIADVRVIEETRVVLEVMSEGELLGKTSKVMEGQGTISVNEVGDRISFHGINCEDPSIERNY